MMLFLDNELVKTARGAVGRLMESGEASVTFKGPGADDNEATFMLSKADTGMTPLGTFEEGGDTFFVGMNTEL